LRAGGMFRVITNLGVFGFDEKTRAMKVLALHHGVTLEQVQDNTGFDLLYDKNELSVTAAPTDQELQALRELDPDRRYIA
jgi:glutaconate CoA-transferase subunit B